MTNFYNDYSEKVVRELRAYFLELVAESKKHHREYKTLEREVFKMTARLLKKKTDVDCLGTPTDTSEIFNWQNRKDLQ